MLSGQRPRRWKGAGITSERPACLSLSMESQVIALSVFHLASMVGEGGRVLFAFWRCRIVSEWHVRLSGFRGRLSTLREHVKMNMQSMP